MGLALQQGTDVIHVGVVRVDRRIDRSAIAMPAQIERQGVTVRRQSRSDEIIPVGVGAAAV